MNAVGLLARKEAGELLLSSRGLGWLLAVSVVLSGFGLLLIGSQELSLLDNAQVVYDMLGIVTGLGALLAVAAGADAIAGERERGSLLPLLLAPIPRGGLLLGKIAGQAAAWAVMLVLAMPYLWAVGSTGQNMIGGGIALVLLGTPVALGFGFLALGLGARLGSSRGTLMPCLILLLLSASPLLLGPSLRQSAIGVAFDTVNPFSAALNAYDAVVIDGQGAASQVWHGLVALIWLAGTAAFAGVGIHRLRH
jgi:ABC-type transport system involved in multi-copper enzyme maturation permease subunit